MASRPGAPSPAHHDAFNISVFMFPFRHLLRQMWAQFSTQTVVCRLAADKLVLAVACSPCFQSLSASRLLHKKIAKTNREICVTITSETMLHQVGSASGLRQHPACCGCRVVTYRRGNVSGLTLYMQWGFNSRCLNRVEPVVEQLKEDQNLFSVGKAVPLQLLPKALFIEYLNYLKKKNPPVAPC